MRKKLRIIIVSVSISLVVVVLALIFNLSCVPTPSGEPVPTMPELAEEADVAYSRCNQPALRQEKMLFAAGLPAPKGFAEQIPLNTEEYKYLEENGFFTVAARPLSTFGADVDTAGYANVRRMLMQENRLPVKDAVRLEEFLNYFHYDYPAPQGDAPFAVTFELGKCPWNPEHRLLLIGVQGREIALDDLPPSNIVFLIDNSGSMYGEMELLRKALGMLVDQLRPQDKISLVTYGGGAKVLLDSVDGGSHGKIKAEISKLEAGGFTPGAAGIRTAYELARKNFIKDGNNRVILVSDGDFNVGVSSESELVELIENQRDSGVYLTVVGMGYGNYKDNKMKMLANKGNGNYIYLDNPREARHALVNEMTGRMFTLAKDVKFQVEFNPARVFGYRLLGYELRKLEDRDFNDDAKDSGEVGVGHQITVLYELVTSDASDAVKLAASGNVDPLKYQSAEPAEATTSANELLTFKLRYQEPQGDAPSRLLTFVPAPEPGQSANWEWASAVAEFALLLRDSPHKGTADFNALLARARKSLGDDPNGQRAEFLSMATAARDLAGK